MSDQNTVIPPETPSKVKEYLISGVAVFAALAIVLGYGIKPQADLASAAIVAVVGIFALVMSMVISDTRMVEILKWFVLGTFLIWCAAFGLHRVYPANDAFRCLAYPFSDCLAVTDQNAIAENPAPPLQAQPIAPPAQIDPKAYQVYMQFAGTIRRDDVKTAMREMAKAGWNMQGVEGGGERTVSAAGFAEVRYGVDADQSAANALAEAVNKTRLISKPVAAKKVAAVPANRLEIFVSN